MVYTNDANAATLYAHYARFGDDAPHHSSVAVIVGTGLGGGLVEGGQVVSGVAGMAGELGHVQIPLEGLLVEGQPVPACNCGLRGDVESFASLSGIEQNLLPYWLSRYPGHGLAEVQPLSRAAKLVRGYGEAGDPMALKIFEQQAMALGRVFSIAAMFTDPGTYFVGGRRGRGRSRVRGMVPRAGSASTPRSGPSRPSWSISRWSRTWTGLVRAAPRSPHAQPSVTTHRVTGWQIRSPTGQRRGPSPSRRACTGSVMRTAGSFTSERRRISGSG